MKKLFLMAGTVVALAACSPQRPGVVENPDVAGTNTRNLDITRVETTDSTTVLHFNVNFHPGWWIKISPESYVVADGDTARLIRADGIDPGAEHYMPESGTDSFTLTFGAIPVSAKTLTFSEGGDGWAMWGIDLTGKAGGMPDVPAKILRAGDTGEFVEPVLEVGETRFKLHIIDYAPEMGKKLPVRIYGLGGSSFDESVELNADGVAEFTAPVYGTSTLGIYPGLGSVSLLVAPGGETEVFVDSRVTTAETRRRLGKEPLRYEYDNGRYAWLNKNSQELANSDGQQSDELSLKPIENAWELTPEQYTDSLIAAYNACKESINSMMTDEIMRQYLHNNLELNLLSEAEQANNRYINSYYLAHPDFDGRPGEIDITMPGTKAIGPVLELIDIDKPELLINNMYGWLVADIPGEMLKPGSQAAEVALYREMYEKADKGELTEEDIAAVASLSKPFYSEALAAHAKVAMAKIEALKTMVRPTPQVSPDKVFDAIVAPHKGKVVVVDLWNTWCGPCRRALAANEPLKTGELADDDIVWIYIADSSSDAAKYADMIPDIKGLHYRVDSDEIKAIRDRFEVDGIPYYILVDRDGNATGRPDLRDHSKYVETIKAAL